MLHRITKTLSALPIILQKVVSHALGRFWPNPWQTTQRLNQRLKTGRIHLEGELETWRQIKSCRKPRHLFLTERLTTSHGVIERRRNQVFKHFSIIHYSRINAHTANVM
jgi:hypothetical protein